MNYFLAMTIPQSICNLCNIFCSPEIHKAMLNQKPFSIFNQVSNYHIHKTVLNTWWMHMQNHNACKYSDSIILNVCFISVLQVLIGWLLAMQAWVYFLGSLCGIYGRKSGTGTVILKVLQFSPVRYHTNHVPNSYLFVYHQS
jgi:hypothetical protein